ncbi:hypothetical protein KFL_000910070 [Klebsormidium nitens]|uniref:Uncharacterized protein n=1 Tax=Klebsormidium nitens TaxID=105231 RepID=A0A1Y1HZ23_KLENI|nr:hypothetical protein KFL_000910070 [Klebsormidium nitens]|eukprot:GAQ81787.1 hypothetical protein KFL_000910070 [Klebsormidium nitens]
MHEDIAAEEVIHRQRKAIKSAEARMGAEGPFKTSRLPVSHTAGVDQTRRQRVNREAAAHYQSRTGAKSWNEPVSMLTSYK